MPEGREEGDRAKGFLGADEFIFGDIFEEGGLEHFAFTATGAGAFEALLDQRGERYRKATPPGGQTVAYNLWDPDGNHIHVDFAVPE